MYAYDQEQELTEIPWDSYFLQGINKAMGHLGVPGDYPELQYEEESGEDITFTDEQNEAMDEYEIAYYRLMEAGQNVSEAFGFISTYGN